MKRLHASSLALLLALSCAAAAQNTNSSTTNTKTPGGTNSGASANKRGPIFRATKDQIKQAQTLLRERRLYAGEPTGKLDDDTRASLKKYQEAEGLKVTGTLNRLTLEKMRIELTERQKAIS